MKNAPGTYSTVFDIKNPAMVGCRVKLQVRISSYKEPEPVTTEGVTKSVMVLSLEDCQGRGILENVELCDQDLIELVGHTHCGCSSCEIVGTVLIKGKRKKTYSLDIEDIRPCDSALAIIRASDAEAREAERRVADLTSRGVPLLDHILDELADIIGIVGLDRHPHLKEALQVVMMQAVSDGRVAKSSGRIHAFVIGRPATGKKLLSIAAGILNPCHEEVGKSISKAGLVGYPEYKNGAWRRSMGAIPRAHHGTVSLEDYHELSPTVKKEFESHYSKVMEDGYIKDTKADNLGYDALTAFLIDSNLPSQVWSGEDGDLDARVLPAQNVLSRIDYFTVFPEDNSVAVEVGAQICRRIGEIQTDHEEWAELRVRKLKVLVGLLKERYQKVVVAEEAKAGIEKVYDGLVEDFGASTSVGDWIGSYLPRKAIHIYRLVRAQAGLHGRQEVNPDDVKVAEWLLQRTLESLRRFVAPTAPTGSPLDDIAWRAFSGRGSVSPNDVGRYVRKIGQDTTSDSESLRNKVNRILARLVRDGKARKSGPGSYCIQVHPAAASRREAGGVERHPVLTSKGRERFVSLLRKEA